MTQTKAKKWRPSVGAIQQKIVLNSQEAQNAFRFFPAYALRGLSLVIKLMKTKEIDKEKVQNELESILKSIVQEIMERKQKLEQLCEENGIDTNIAFTNPREVTVQITTPKAFQFLQVILGLDEIVKMANALWFAQIIDDEEFLETTKHPYRRIRKAGTRIRNLANETFRKIREEREKKAEESAEEKEIETAIEEAEKEIEDQEKAEEEETKEDLVSEEDKEGANSGAIAQS